MTRDFRSRRQMRKKKMEFLMQIAALLLRLKGHRIVAKQYKTPVGD
jgi:hypothetical protein